MNKYITSVITVALSAVIFAACGSETADKPETASPEREAVPAAATEEPESVEKGDDGGSSVSAEESEETASEDESSEETTTAEESSAEESNSEEEKKADDTALMGYWYLSGGVKADGSLVDFRTLLEEEGEYSTLHIAEDGNGLFDYFGEDIAVSWVNGEITLGDDPPYSYTISGEKMTLTNGTESLIFDRVDDTGVMTYTFMTDDYPAPALLGKYMLVALYEGETQLDIEKQGFAGAGIEFYDDNTGYITSSNGGSTPFTYNDDQLTLETGESNRLYVKESYIYVEQQNGSTKYTMVFGNA